MPKSFMSFLDNTDTRYTNEVEDEMLEEAVEEVVEDIKPVVEKVVKKKVKKTKPKPKSKDATVKILEQRMKMKLDEVGLNSKMINEVLDYVLYNIEKIKDLPQPTQVAETTKPQKNLSSVYGRAEAILDDLMFSAPVVTENVGIGGSDPQPVMYSTGNLNLNKTSDRATAILM